VFSLPKDASTVVVLVDEVSLDQLDGVRAAVKYCPTHALSLEEN